MVVVKRAFALFLACTASCAPVVTHGPRVDPGFTLYGTGGGGWSRCARPACDTRLVPQHGAGVRFGRAATASRPGWSAGLTASTALVSSELDLYVQAPRSLGLDAGAGVLAAGSHAMPYVQAGHMMPDGSGLYTTQGFAILASRSARWSTSLDGGASPERVEPRYWAPTVAYRTRGRYGMHMYVSGAFGTADAKKYRGKEPGFHTVRQPVRMVMLGMVFDVRPVRADRPPLSAPATVAPLPPPPSARPR